MSDDNPFDDLGIGESDSGEPDSSEGNDTQVSETSEPVSEPEPTREEVSPQSKPQPEPADDERDLSGPAFEYSEVRQRPLYARGETWDKFEDELGITVIPGLRRERIRDEETRELHDAALEVAVRHADEVLDVVLERRQR